MDMPPNLVEACLYLADGVFGIKKSLYVKD